MTHSPTPEAIPRDEHGLSGRQSRSNGLERIAADLRRQSLAPSTLRAYRDQLRWFDRWLDSRNLHPKGPVEQDEALATWIASRFEDGASPSTIAQGLAAVRFAAREGGEPNPAGPKTAATMRGVRRAGWSRGTGQVQGMTWVEVDAAASAAARDGDMAGLRDAALLRLGSDGLLRASELVAVNWPDLEPAGNGGATLRIRRSKTDPTGDGATVYVGKRTWDATRDWAAASGVGGNGPLFVSVRRSGRVQVEQRMTTRSVRRIIRQRARAVGIEGRISGHSLRIGSARDLVRAGVDLPGLMQAGRWRSAATAVGYVANELAGRGAVARLRYGAGV